MKSELFMKYCLKNRLNQKLKHKSLQYDEELYVRVSVVLEKKNLILISYKIYWIHFFLFYFI